MKKEKTRKKKKKKLVNTREDERRNVETEQSNLDEGLSFKEEERERYMFCFF